MENVNSIKRKLKIKQAKRDQEDREIYKAKEKVLFHNRKRKKLETEIAELYKLLKQNREC